MDNEFFKLVKPQNIFQKKVRVGPNEDGGYVMTEDILTNCSALMSYGVGNEIRYEEQFARDYKKPVYMFDHTIGHPAWKRDGIQFIPENLGTSENAKEWYQHYEELNLSGDIFLKVDVEGYEFQYFTNTDLSKLADKVMALSLEVHYIDNAYNRMKFIEILNLLDPNFILFHIHGNSWGDLWEYEGYDIPKVLELSFVNRKYVVQYEPDTQDYPIEGLDVSNCPHREDYKLTFLKH